MEPNVQFFYDNAGYSYNPATGTEEMGRIHCANRLAQAEIDGRHFGLTFEWVPDNDADPMDWDGDGPMGDEAYGCVVRDPEGNIRASLWAIFDPTPQYRRVVEAELAMQALA